MNRNELEEIRRNLLAESANALTTHHKALGALELLDFLLINLAEEEPEAVDES